MEKEVLGTVVSTFEGPSPSRVDFVVNNGMSHKGMFVELNYSQGTMICMVDELIKTNRYFERPDSVKSMGQELEKHFPTADWEFLIARAKPLGIFSNDLIQRSTFPPSPGTKVYVAENEHIKKFLGIDSKGLMLGQIPFHDMQLKLNLSKLLQKHLAVLAMSGAGKCLKPDAKIKLSDGRTTAIKSLVDDALSQEKVTVDGVETSTKNNQQLSVFGINSENKIVKSKIKAFMRRKAPKKVVKIKTASGRELELTKEHPVPTLNEGINWVPAGQLKTQDYLFVPRVSSETKESEIDLRKGIEKIIPFGKYFKVDNMGPSKKIPNKIKVEKRFAKFLAYLLAEGHNQGEYIVFSNNNPKIMLDFKEISKNLFFESVHKIKNKGEVRIYNKGLAQALINIGFTNSSWTKFIPEEILQSPKEVQWAFLSAFIDCEGGFSDKALEITLSSKSMIESMNELFLQNDIVPILKDKKYKEKDYKRLFVSGANNMKTLLKNSSLLVDYKKETLKNLSLKTNNYNIDILPNCSQTIKNIFENLHLPTINSNYIYNRKAPSINQVQKLVCCAENRFNEVELMIARLKEIFYSLPDIFENDTKEIICNAYEKFDFNVISNNAGVSSTTARMITHGVTKPKSPSYVLAQNSLKLEGETDFGIDTIVNLKFKELSIELNNICKMLGFEIKTILSEEKLSKGGVYSWSQKDNMLNYSNFYKFAKRVFKTGLLLEQKLPFIKKQINMLKELVNSGVFFDEIISIEEKKPNYNWVYDLSVEHSSFVANNILVHNSYFVSVLLEELLNRKKEDGQIAIIAFDTHGEYTCFGEPVSDSKDFSSKTKIINGKDVKIALSNITQSMLSSIFPKITPVQKRELFRIISRLREEMKSGVGPFNLDAVRAEVQNLDDKTAFPLLSVISDLSKLNLFGKIDTPNINDLAKQGQLTVIDLNGIINEKKKQLIVAYVSQKLFNLRRQKKVPPFAVLVEEAHNFIPESTAGENALARFPLRLIAREGRKFGASLIVVSQRPKRLDTTTLANCNTNIILKITNPYDLDHIKQSSEGLDQNSVGMISSLRVGEALIVGEGVNAPTFFKVRLRESSPSKHESSLEASAKQFSSSIEKDSDEVNTFL